VFRASFVIRHSLLVVLLAIFLAADEPTSATTPATTQPSAPQTADTRPPALIAAMAAAATQPSEPKVEEPARTSSSFSSYSRSSSARTSSSRTARPGSSTGYSRDTRSTYSPPSDDLLLNKSIFSRDRRPAPPPTGPRPDPPPPKPRDPAIPVLVGIILEDNGFIAYLEDPDSGKIWPFAVGDPLPMDAGIVNDICIDAMEIVKNGDPPKRIDIGYNLTGNPVATSPSYSSPSSDAPSFDTDALRSADPSTLSPADRMRLRRLQQTGQ